MYLIDEQDGFPLAESELVLRLLYHLSHLTCWRAGGWEGHEAYRAFLFTGTGNDVGQGCLQTDKKNKPLGQISIK